MFVFIYSFIFVPLFIFYRNVYDLNPDPFVPVRIHKIKWILGTGWLINWSVYLISIEKSPHYLVLDTNVVLEQIDMLESEGLNNVIILNTGIQFIGSLFLKNWFSYHIFYPST